MAKLFVKRSYKRRGPLSARIRPFASRHQKDKLLAEERQLLSILAVSAVLRAALFSLPPCYLLKDLFR
jgi:hypothetical protein